MKKPSASQIAIGFVAFLFFLLITFPYQNLRTFVFKKVFESTGIVITADSMSPNFFGWPGISLSNASISVPSSGGDMSVSAKSLVVRVRLAGFLPPIPAVSVAADGLKGGGDLYVRLAKSGQVTHVVAEANKANLAQFSIPGFPETIPGIVTLDADVSVDAGDLSRTAGNIDLSIDKLVVPALNLQGIILPVLNLGEIRAKLAAKNAAAEILNFKIGNKTSDLSGTITGDMRLGQNLMASALNLTLKLSLSPSYVANPQGATLVSLLQTYKNPGGDYGLKWNSTIQEMTTNVAAALPQRVP